jgi:pilus assembly protein Flp/PilA
LRKLLIGDDGATAIEYGLIAALIAVAAIGGMSALGGGSGTMWGDIKDKVLAVM